MCMLAKIMLFEKPFPQNCSRMQFYKASNFRKKITKSFRKNMIFHFVELHNRNILYLCVGNKKNHGVCVPVGI